MASRDSNTAAAAVAIVCLLSLAVLHSADAAQPALTSATRVINGDGTPKADHAKLLTWLKAESLETYADAATLTTWTSTKNGGDATGGSDSGGVKPIVKRNMINGYHAARVTKSGKGYFETGNLVTSNGANTVCAVFRLLTSAVGATNNDIAAVVSHGVAAKFYFGPEMMTSGPSGKTGVTHDGGTAKATSTPTYNFFDWHVACVVSGTQVAPSASTGNKHAVYLDGTQSEPVKNSATATASIESSGVSDTMAKFRVGWLAAGKEFEGDVAVLIAYDAALTGYEVDRVGTYLARKFGLQWNRFGGSGAMDGSATADKITVGGIRSGGEGLAAGGTVLTIYGKELFPGDATIADAAKQTDLLAGLRVNVGKAGSVCSDPKRTAPCTESTLTMAEATDCVVWSLDASCDTSGGTFKGCEGTLQCRAPAGLGPDADIAIHWQGVPYILHSWYHYQEPQVSSVTPSTISFSGGSKITIKGKNFGPKEMWTKTTAGGSTTSMTRTAQVEIVTRVNLRCTAVQWVSDSELVCTAPAIPKAKLAVDTTARTLAANVIVDAAGARSQQFATGGRITYSSVPAYYTCENSGTDALSRSDCYSCCRHSCVTEEFAKGGQQGAVTYSSCDSQCISYCGFSSRRRTLSFASLVKKLKAML